MSQRRTCDGRCCAVFPLEKGVAERLKEATRGTDNAFIADMLIPLTVPAARARLARFGWTFPRSWFSRNYRWSGGQAFTKAKDLFTCRHWDEDTRLCTVYDQRPAMCRDYPYEGKCNFSTEGCCYRKPERFRRVYAKGKS